MNERLLNIIIAKSKELDNKQKQVIITYAKDVLDNRLQIAYDYFEKHPEISEDEKHKKIQKIYQDGGKYAYQALATVDEMGYKSLPIFGDVFREIMSLLKEHSDFLGENDEY